MQKTLSFEHLFLERPGEGGIVLVHIVSIKRNEHAGQIGLDKNESACMVLGVPAPKIAFVWQ